jgi:hypothetical protein
MDACVFDVEWKQCMVLIVLFWVLLTSMNILFEREITVFSWYVKNNFSS